MLKAKNYALRLLSYRPRSIKETVDRLRRKGYADDAVKRVIDDLKRANYLNDLEFVRFWVSSRLRTKPMGKSLLGYELERKGIAPEIIDKVLNEIEEGYNEKEIAKDLVMDRLRRYKNLDAITSKRRIYSLLKRRGFSSDVINEAMEEIYSE